MATAPAPLIPSPEASRAANVVAEPNNGGAAPVTPAATSTAIPTEPTADQLAARQAATANPNGSAAVTQAQTTQNTNNSAADDLAGSTGTSTTTQPTFVSSSDSVESNENDISNTVNNLTANNQATTDAHNTYLNTLSQELTSLQAEQASQTASINSEFDSQETALNATQANETGEENVTLQRSGGYLGQGASQTGALISLNQTHAAEQAQLESARQAAVQAAQSAIDDKEFSVAQAQAQEAKDYVAAIQQNQQTYLSNQIAIQKSQEDAVTFAQTQAQTQLTSLSTLSPTQLSAIPQSTFDSIDQTYGVPGFAQSYVAAAQATAAATSASDVLTAQSKMLTMLQSIPKGQSVTFPDPTNPSGPGTTYTGLGSTSDISTFTETDDQGRVTLFTYDKGSNTVTKTSLGAGGSTKSTSTADAANATAARLGPATTAIQALAVPLDPNTPGSPKFITANQYVNAYQTYIAQNPGRGSEFLTNFPMDETVLPSQGTLAQTLLREAPAATASK